MPLSIMTASFHNFCRPWTSTIATWSWITTKSRSQSSLRKTWPPLSSQRSLISLVASPIVATRRQLRWLRRSQAHHKSSSQAPASSLKMTAMSTQTCLPETPIHRLPLIRTWTMHSQCSDLWISTSVRCTTSSAKSANCRSKETLMSVARLTAAPSTPTWRSTTQRGASTWGYRSISETALMCLTVAEPIVRSALDVTWSSIISQVKVTSISAELWTTRALWWAKTAKTCSGWARASTASPMASEHVKTIELLTASSTLQCQLEEISVTLPILV